MNKYRFSSKLPTDDSNRGSIDPHSIKEPGVENTPKQKSELTVRKTERAVEDVDPPALVTEYKFTVQTKIEPASQAHAQPRFTLGQQKHRTATPISEPMEKPGSATEREGWPSSPTRNHKLNPQTKVEQVTDYGVINNTREKPKSSVHDPNHSSQAKLEPGKDSEFINNKWDKPLTTVSEQNYSSPIKAGPQKKYGGFNDDKQDMPSSPIHGQTHSSPRKSYGVFDEKQDKPPIKAGPQKKYGGFNDDKQDMPSGPIHGQTHSSPRKSYGVFDEKQDKPSTLAREHKYKTPTTEVGEAKNYGSIDNKWGKAPTPVQERPEKVDGFFTKVQTEASRPTRPSILSGKNWRENYNKGLEKPKNDNVKYKQVIEPYEVGDNVYDEYDNYRNKGSDIPSNNNVRYKQVIEQYEVGGKNRRDIDGTDVYGEYANYGNYDMDKPSNDIVRYEQVTEPYTAGKRRLEGPRMKEWAIPPTQVTPIFGLTSDIGKAVEILKEAVISAQPPRYNYNYTERHSGAIDSREAQRGFGNPNPSARPSNNYIRTISSTKAAWKYGGAPV